MHKSAFSSSHALQTTFCTWIACFTSWTFLHFFWHERPTLNRGSQLKTCRSHWITVDPINHCTRCTCAHLCVGRKCSLCTVTVVVTAQLQQEFSVVIYVTITMSADHNLPYPVAYLGKWQAWVVPWAPLWRGRKNCLGKLQIVTYSFSSTYICVPYNHKLQSCINMEPFCNVLHIATWQESM